MLSEEELALLQAIRDSGSLSRAAARRGSARLRPLLHMRRDSSKRVSTRCFSIVAAIECS